MCYLTLAVQCGSDQAPLASLAEPIAFYEGLGRIEQSFSFSEFHESPEPRPQILYPDPTGNRPGRT